MSASAKSRMVYPSGTDSPGQSWTKGRKTVVVIVRFVNSCFCVIQCLVPVVPANLLFVYVASLTAFC